MRLKLIIVCFPIAFDTGVIQGQKTHNQERLKFVVVPGEQILVTIAEQPGCPTESGFMITVIEVVLCKSDLSNRCNSKLFCQWLAIRFIRHIPM